jgi:MFS family permease
MNMLFGFNGRVTRNFLVLLVSMHFILFIDRVNLAAAAQAMQKDLGLSNIALGLAFSAFNYSYAPFQLVGGWFADRFWRAPHADCLRLGVVAHDNRDRGGDRAGIAVWRASSARHG